MVYQTINRNIEEYLRKKLKRKIKISDYVFVDHIYDLLATSFFVLLSSDYLSLYLYFSINHSILYAKHIKVVNHFEGKETRGIYCMSITNSFSA